MQLTIQHSQFCEFVYIRFPMTENCHHYLNIKLLRNCYDHKWCKKLIYFLRLYTPEEDEKIIRYTAENKRKKYGDRFWQNMEIENVMHCRLFLKRGLALFISILEEV